MGGYMLWLCSTKTVVLNTLIPLPSYLFSPRARLLLDLHVSGSVFKTNSYRTVHGSQANYFSPASELICFYSN